MENLNWKNGLKESALKYHTIACWVAIALNPVWGVADFFTTPDNWKVFLVFRFAVAAITLFALVFRKKFNVSVEMLAFIPLTGISLQNAYMYSVMDVAAFQKHTFAYIALFIGGGMLVLWKPLYSYIMVIITLLANAIMFTLFSQLTIDEFLINGGLLTGTVAIFTIVLIHTRYNLTKKEIIARLALAASNLELEGKNEIIAAKNKDITDSINYAKGIQFAMLAAKEDLSQMIPECFILFRPKDIISGDFYWFVKIQPSPENKFSKKPSIQVAAADCTGHGVPGALMSLIGHSLLNQTINIQSINTPSETLNFISTEIRKTLKSIKDGMDIALLSFDFEKNIMHYSGANNPVYIIRNKELIEIKPDKQPIGAPIEYQRPFTDHSFELKKNDTIYIFTDGYADQFGGPKGKKFMYRQFKELLLEINSIPMAKQEQILEKAVNDWRGEHEQVDDILVIGIKV